MIQVADDQPGLILIGRASLLAGLPVRLFEPCTGLEIFSGESLAPMAKFILAWSCIVSGWTIL